MRFENQVFTGCPEVPRKVRSEISKTIRTAINGLTKTPPEGDIKLMKGYHDGRQRLRLGGWRIIYRYDLSEELEILFIIDIGNRGDVYK